MSDLKESLHSKLDVLIIRTPGGIRAPGGMQLSVAYLLIDGHPEEGDTRHAFTRHVFTRHAFPEIRQVRGYNWDGMHVFTVGIEHGDKLDREAGRLKIGKFECSLIESDPDRELLVWDHLCNDPEARDRDPVVLFTLDDKVAWLFTSSLESK